jgi:hypothetical protein
MHVCMYSCRQFEALCRIHSSSVTLSKTSSALANSRAEGIAPTRAADLVLIVSVFEASTMAGRRLEFRIIIVDGG